MSIASKLQGLTSGLDEAINRKNRKDEKEGRIAEPGTSSKGAPVQLLQFRAEVLQYEDKIAALEAKLKDAATTQLAVNTIGPNPWQPRRRFDPDKLQELANSIAAEGLIQPIVVRRAPLPEGGSQAVNTNCVHSIYQLVAGERRLRAHRMLGLRDIKAVVIEASDERLAILALVENIDREDLTDYEISRAIHKAEKEFKSRNKMAQSLGMHRTEFYRYTAFEKLPDFVRCDLEEAPSILGRYAAQQIAASLDQHGARAVNCLRALWPRIKTGAIEQTKAAATIEATIAKGETVRTERDIRKLFLGKEQAGSITRDAATLTVKIRSAALTPSMEADLRSFVEKMFAAKS